jgi:YVTN family beta-propeller protein
MINVGVATLARPDRIPTIACPEGFPMPLRRALAALSALLLALTGVIVTAAPAQAATNIPVAGASDINDVVINDAGTVAYIVDRAANKVFFFDLATKTVTSSVSVSASPYRAALNPAETRLYVAHYSGSRPWTTVIDTTTASVITTVNDTGRGTEGPIVIEVNPSGSQAWVGNYASTGPGSITVISTADNTVARNIPTGAAITSISFRADGAYAYAIGSLASKIFVISTSTYAVTEIALTGARAVGASPTDAKAYVATPSGLRILDTSTNTLDRERVIPIGPSTSDIAFSPDGSRVYLVGNSNSSTLDVIDTATDEVAAGTEPFGVRFASAVAVDPNDIFRVFTAAGYSALVEHSIPRSFDQAAGVSTDATSVVRPGQVLTASIDVDAKPMPTSYTYQWFVGDSAAAGATTTSFTVPTNATGKKVQVRVTPTLAGYVSSTGVGSSTTSTVTAQAFTSAPTPAIEGTYAVDDVLTAVAGTWDSVATLSYAWRADDSPVTGSTKTLTLTPELVGKSITVTVTGQAAGYEPTSRTSAPVGPVAQGVFTDRAELVITGTARVGEKLSATVTTQAVPRPSSYLYQWFVDDEPITGATGKTLVLDPTFQGAQVRVLATPVRAGYSMVEVSSVATSEVIAAGQFSAAPVIEIQGDSEVGKTVTAAVVTWASPVPSTYSYKWFADDVVIPGATLGTLELVPAFVGAEISVAVSPRLTGYDSTTGIGTARTKIAVEPGSFITAPSVQIVGDVEVGATLTASIAAEAAPVPSDYTYQWLADGQPIAGATSRTFVPTGAELNKVLSVRVQPRLTGYVSASGEKTSDASAPVGVGSFTNSALVQIQGVAQVGQTLTGTVVLGASPAPTSYTYQWFAGGSPIDGATTATFVLTAAQAGDTISFVATPQLAGYDSQTGRGKSGATAAVVALALSLDSAKAGGEVVVTGSGLAPGSTYSVQLFSTPVVLGAVTADPSGAFTQSFAIPADTAPGAHQIKLFDAAGMERASLGITILAAPAAVGTAAGGATGLSATGGSIGMGWVAFGLGSLLLGALLIAVRRRVGARS